MCVISIQFNKVTHLAIKLLHAFNILKLYAGVVLLDLQKAFDTVDHHILLSKLKVIGADDFAVKWFSSYLNERKQFVGVLGKFSSKKGIRCGVPQGSHF